MPRLKQNGGGLCRAHSRATGTPAITFNISSISGTRIGSEDEKGRSLFFRLELIRTICIICMPSNSTPCLLLCDKSPIQMYVGVRFDNLLMGKVLHPKCMKLSSNIHQLAPLFVDVFRKSRYLRRTPTRRLIGITFLGKDLFHGRRNSQVV